MCYTAPYRNVVLVFTKQKKKARRKNALSDRVFAREFPLDINRLRPHAEPESDIHQSVRQGYNSVVINVPVGEPTNDVHVRPSGPPNGGAWEIMVNIACAAGMRSCRYSEGLHARETKGQTYTKNHRNCVLP